jgi:hypothetical protein
MDSETMIGQVLKNRRKECIIATKTHSRTYDEVMADLEESLKQLQTDRIEIYQVHELYAHEKEAVMSRGGALEAMKKARDQGMVDFIGLTSHDVDLAIELMKTGEFDTVMIPFNVIERKPEKELLSLARTLDIGTLMMKPLAGGAIRNIEKAFRFFNGYPCDVILNGVVSLEELYGNLRHAESAESLSDQELKDFEEEVAPLGQDFCRRCSYCLPCPNDILVPVFIHVIWQKMQGRRYEELTELERRMGQNMLLWWQGCVECGQCEQKCPYDLPTIKRKNYLLALFSLEES